MAVLYASAYGNTATLAQAISRGITKAGVGVEMVNLEQVSLKEAEEVLRSAQGFTIGVCRALVRVFATLLCLSCDLCIVFAFVSCRSWRLRRCCARRRASPSVRATHSSVLLPLFCASSAPVL